MTRSSPNIYIAFTTHLYRTHQMRELDSNPGKHLDQCQQPCVLLQPWQIRWWQCLLEMMVIPVVGVDSSNVLDPIDEKTAVMPFWPPCLLDNTLYSPYLGSKFGPSTCLFPEFSFLSCRLLGPGVFKFIKYLYDGCRLWRRKGKPAGVGGVFNRGFFLFLL